MKNNTTAPDQDPNLDDPADNVDMPAVIQEWKLAKAFVENYTRDFKDLDNLVDGVSINKQDDVPFVGDTTMAGLVKQIPRDSIEQLPVFSAIINGTKNSIPALVSTFLLKKTVFNEQTFGKGLLSTLQIGCEQALTHGYAPFMCSTGTQLTDFGTTLRLLHFADTAVEPGITDGNEMGYSYVTANLTKTRVQKIRKNALSNPETNWNTDALQQVLDATPRAKNYSIYQSDPRKNAAGEESGPTYEIVTRYESGPGGTTITFCPDIEDTPLRVIQSKSKFGYPRVQLLVIDPAALTPFGVSRVRLASPNQNLMNIYYGNIAAMLLLNSAPPILKRGRFVKPVQLKRNAVWETLDQNASADLKTIDNGSLQMFPEMAKQFAGQIQTLMGQAPGPVGATSTFSKTGPGVQQQNQVQNSSTNQITKILENFLRQYALVGLDTLLSEQLGEDNLIVDDDTKNAINQLAPGTIGDDNKILINWPRFYAAIEDLAIEIEISVSKDEMEEKQRGDLQDMLVVLAQNAQALGPEAVQKVQEITDMLMQDIAPDVKPIDVGSAAPQPQPAGQVVAPGGQVHETGDLVKLFASTTDPVLRNAILKAMGLPQVATAMPPVVQPQPTASRIAPPSPISLQP